MNHYLQYLPVRIIEAVMDYRWNCGCGVTGLGVAINKAGIVEGQCYGCKTTISWNNLGMFGEEKNPLVCRDVTPKPKSDLYKNGWWAPWYREHRARVFHSRI